jgi:formylglycine-generating enzyme required for sulfatase activity
MKTAPFGIAMWILLFCVLSIPNLPAVSRNGLVAWYPFAGNAQDASGNGHHGTASGPNLVNDRFSNPSHAYNFYRNQQDYISVPDHPDLQISNALTISVWIYRPGYYYPGSFEDIVMKGADSYGFQYNDSTDEVLFHITSNGWRNLNSNTEPIMQNWYHFTGTYDGEWQRVYVNGVETNSQYFTGGINTNSSPLFFGYKVADDNGWYNGIMDDCCVFNRALSADEVWDLYKIGVDTSAVSSPQDISISQASGIVNLDWDPVSNADLYTVYSSDFPYIGFTQDNSGTYDLFGWSALASEEKKFYKVTAGNTQLGHIPEMVFVEGGTFNNGVSDVTLDSYYISKYEFTQAQRYWATGETSSYGFGGGPLHPVYNVTWLKAIAACNLLSAQQGLSSCYTLGAWGSDPNNWPQGYSTDQSYHNLVQCDWSANGYRLPTEMEWEFAARGGNLSNGYTYSGGNNASAVAWYYYNSGSYPISHQVGTKSANELGLHDMSGNVGEFVWDKYGDLPENPQTNPTGAVASSFRVHRGGHFSSGTDYITVSFRSNVDPQNNYHTIGFRVCRRYPGTGR